MRATDKIYTYRVSHNFYRVFCSFADKILVILVRNIHLLLIADRNTANSLNPYEIAFLPSRMYQFTSRYLVVHSIPN